MLKMGTKMRKFTDPGDANGDFAMYQSATTRHRQYSFSPFPLRYSTLFPSYVRMCGTGEGRTDCHDAEDSQREDALAGPDG